MTDLTVKQTASRLKVSPRTIHAWIHSGQFPNAYKLNPDRPNSPYRIPSEDVEDFDRKRHRQ